MGWTLVARWH